MTEQEEQNVLDAWKEKFKTLSDELDKLIKETGTEWIKRKEQEFKEAQGKRALEFPRVGGFKPAEVLVFQPSITGFSGGVTGLNLSVTGVSFAYTCFKARNGGVGFEPAVFDNKDKIMASRLCGNRLEADMTRISTLMTYETTFLTTCRDNLMRKLNAGFDNKV